MKLPLVFIACALALSASSCGEDEPTSLEVNWAHVTVIQGAIFGEPPPAGIIDVFVDPKDGVKLTDAELSYDGVGVTYAIALEPGPAGLPLCMAGDGTDRTELAQDGFTGESTIKTIAQLPRVGAGGFHLRVHYERDGEEHWAQVRLSDVCYGIA